MVVCILKEQAELLLDMDFLRLTCRTNASAKATLMRSYLPPFFTDVGSHVAVISLKMPPGFEKENTVFRLKKALYGLRRSPLLWQTELTKSFREMGFKEVPQEPCVMMKGSVIVFFYVDDIVFCYRKKDVNLANEAIDSLQRRYSIKDLGELKWFLGVHVLRDRTKKCL